MQGSETVNGTGPIWLNSVLCTESETRITDCTISAFGGHNCTHSSDVGVICQGKEQKNFCYPKLLALFHEVLTALGETSDFREEVPILDEWKSVTTMSGAQCVMTSGGLLMLELPVYNWDYQVHVIF